MQAMAAVFEFQGYHANELTKGLRKLLEEGAHKLPRCQVEEVRDLLATLEEPGDTLCTVTVTARPWPK